MSQQELKNKETSKMICCLLVLFWLSAIRAEPCNACVTVPEPMCPPCNYPDRPPETRFGHGVFQPAGCLNDNNIPSCDVYNFQCITNVVCPTVKSNAPPPTPPPTPPPEPPITAVGFIVPTPATMPKPQSPSPAQGSLTTRILHEAPPNLTPTTSATTATTTTVTATIETPPPTLTLPVGSGSDSLLGDPASLSNSGGGGGETLSSLFTQTFPDVAQPDSNLIGAIVGGVLGCLLLLGIVIAVVVVMQRRKRDKAVLDTPSSMTEATPMPTRSQNYGAAPLVPVYDAGFASARYDAAPPNLTYEQPNDTFLS